MLVFGSSDISNPLVAMKALNKYTGSAVSLSLNSTQSSITLIKAEADGSTPDDNLTLSLLWDKMPEEAARSLYTHIRSSTNKKLRVQIGREEFFGVLLDSTVIETNDLFIERFYQDFSLTFSEIQSTSAKSPILAKKHKSSIIEAPIPENIWKQIISRVDSEDVYKGDPPHITLLFFPDLSKGKDLDAIKAVIESVCAKYSHMQVTITGSSKFKTDKDVDPYFAAVSSSGLQKVREELIEAITVKYPDAIDLESFPTFVPHVTVSYAEGTTPKLVIKPVSFMLTGLNLSFKGDTKYHFPFSKVKG